MASQNKINAQYICGRRKYTNNLPIADLSCPVKFMNLSFQSLERYAKCGITKLEEEYKYEVWPEDILKHCPPLVDLNIFKKDANATMNEKDALLLQDDFAVPTNSKRSQQHSKIVPWMRKTEYISTEFNRYGVNSDRSENKVGYSIKKKMGNQDNLYKDQNSQIQAIKKIFEETNKPVKKHYSKPGVFAVEEFPLLPDEDQAKYSYVQVIFDADPTPSVKENPKQIQERSILKGMKDQEGNNFVAYFVPTEETLKQKLSEEAENQLSTPEFEYKYTCGREYNWSFQAKHTHGPDVEAYFFTQRDGVMYYCEVDTRVKLNRRAKTANVNRSSILSLTYRDYTEDELKAMERRKNKLYDPYLTGEFIPLEEEEEEDEQAEDEQKQEEEEENDDEDEEKDENAEKAKDSDDGSSSSSSSAEDNDQGEAQSEKSDAEQKSSASSSDDDSMSE